MPKTSESVKHSRIPFGAMSRIRGLAFREKTWANCSPHSSRPKKKAKVSAWDCPLCTGLLRGIKGKLKSLARSTGEQRLRYIWRPWMGKKAIILVVDDEKIVRESLRDWVVDVGYRGGGAETGERAREITKRKRA